MKIKVKESVVWGLFVFAVGVGLFAGVARYSDAQSASLSDEERVEQEKVNHALYVASQLTYVEDDRTNICYAFVWNRQEMLANVPCQSVPARMLHHTWPQRDTQ